MGRCRLGGQACQGLFVQERKSLAQETVVVAYSWTSLLHLRMYSGFRMFSFQGAM